MLYELFFLSIAITLKIDRRKSLGDLKSELETIISLPATEFKVSIGNFLHAVVIVAICSIDLQNI